MESCFSTGLSRVPAESDKVEQQTEAFGVCIMTTSQNRISSFRRKYSLQNVSQVQQRPSTKDHANVLDERNAKTLCFKTYLMALEPLNFIHRHALSGTRQPVLSHIGQTRLLTAKINPSMCDLCSQSQEQSIETPGKPTVSPNIFDPRLAQTCWI